MAARGRRGGPSAGHRRSTKSFLGGGGNPPNSHGLNTSISPFTEVNNLIVLFSENSADTLNNITEEEGTNQQVALFSLIKEINKV